MRDDDALAHASLADVRRLWAAVLLQWLRDCVTPFDRNHKPHHRAEARRTIGSDLFRAVCYVAGFDAVRAERAFRARIIRADARQAGGLRFLPAARAAADPPVPPGIGDPSRGWGDGTRQHPLADGQKIDGENSKKNHTRTPGSDVIRRGGRVSEKARAKISATKRKNFAEKKRRVGQPLQLPVGHPNLKAQSGTTASRVAEPAPTGTIRRASSMIPSAAEHGQTPGVTAPGSRDVGGNIDRRDGGRLFAGAAASHLSRREQCIRKIEGEMRNSKVADETVKNINGMVSTINKQTASKLEAEMHQPRRKRK